MSYKKALLIKKRVFWVPHEFPWIRSSRSQMFFKIGVLKNFTKFTGKELCWSLFLINLQALRLGALLKKRLQHRFSLNITKFLRTAFFKEHLRWLFLMNTIITLPFSYLPSHLRILYYSTTNLSTYITYS